MVHFPRPVHAPRRDSQNSEAYLIGSGIAALSAALHLIKDAQVPPGNIHILDGSPDSGGGLKTQGDAMDGYFLPMDGNPHFHGECLERLLDMIPDMNQGQMQGMGEMPGRSRSEGQEGELEGGKRSVMQRIREREGFEMGKGKETDTKGTQGQVRGVKMGEKGVELFHAGKFQIAMKYRMSLVGLMMENEASMGTKKIEDVFDKEFFNTSFWMLWSSTYVSFSYQVGISANGLLDSPCSPGTAPQNSSAISASTSRNSARSTTSKPRTAPSTTFSSRPWAL
jgi:oleate hydratase